MRVTKNFFLVEIDKSLQKEMMAGKTIIRPDTYTFMQYYLQSGKVLQIGDNARKFFPEVQEGDQLVFHHTVEDDEWRLLETYTDAGGNEYEYRVVKATIDDVFAVRKQDGDLISAREYLWCKELPGKEVKSDAEAFTQTASGLYLMNNDYFSSEEYLRNKIEELDTQAKYIASGGGAREMKDIAITPLRNEMLELTQRLNKGKLHALELVHIHKETAREFDGLAPGDHVYMVGYIDYSGYPLKVDGVEMKLIRKDMLQLALRKQFVEENNLQGVNIYT